MLEFRKWLTDVAGRCYYYMLYERPNDLVGLSYTPGRNELVLDLFIKDPRGWNDVSTTHTKQGPQLVHLIPDQKIGVIKDMFARPEWK